MEINRPFDFLTKLINKDVTVVSINGAFVDGKLKCFDQNINLILERDSGDVYFMRGGDVSKIYKNDFRKK